jgi:hypothetical protein
VPAFSVTASALGRSSLRPNECEKGESKIARDLGLNRIDVHRAVKFASISPEAKQAVRNAGPIPIASAGQHKQHA